MHKSILFLAILIAFSSLSEAQSVNEKLKLTAFSIVDQNDKEGFSMTEEGRVFIQKRQIGVLLSNGEFRTPDGNMMIKMRGDSIVNAKGDFLGRLEQDGNILTDGVEKLSWNNRQPNGKEDVPMYKIIPENSETKKAALIILLGYIANFESPISHDTIRLSN